MLTVFQKPPIFILTVVKFHDLEMNKKTSREAWGSKSRKGDIAI